MFFDRNCAVASGPPGRDELSGWPYCTVGFSLEGVETGVELGGDAPHSSRASMRPGR